MIVKTNLNNLEFQNIFKQFFKDELSSNDFRNYYIYIYNDQILGFIVYSIIYERCELDYIGVLEEYQNTGIASKLMEYMINNCREKDCENISLEVNISNDKAINLYKKYDFKIETIRSNYYGKNDAYLMVLEIGD